MSRVLWAVGGGLLLGLGSCAAYDLPRDEIKALCADWNRAVPWPAVAAPAPAPASGAASGAAIGAAVRLEAAVTIESAGMGGEFLGVLIVRRDPLAVRLQLFPELGGKILDLAATGQWQRGTLPMTGQRLDHPAMASGDPMLRMFAISLLEASAPLPLGRVLGGWRVAAAGPAPAARLHLQPQFGASRCEVTIDRTSGGRVFDLRFGGAGWQMSADGAGVVGIEAPGFRLRAEVTSSEALAVVDDRVFALELTPTR
jgi:hypothetical protein